MIVYVLCRQPHRALTSYKWCRALFYGSWLIIFQHIKEKCQNVISVPYILVPAPSFRVLIKIIFKLGRKGKNMLGSALDVCHQGFAVSKHFLNFFAAPRSGLLLCGHSWISHVLSTLPLFTALPFYNGMCPSNCKTS